MRPTLSRTGLRFHTTALCSSQGREVFHPRLQHRGTQADQYVANGTRFTQPLYTQEQAAETQRTRAEGGDQDTFIIPAVTADHEAELEWAADARERGNLVVCIGPEHAVQMRERVDLYITNGGAAIIPTAYVNQYRLLEIRMT